MSTRTKLSLLILFTIVTRLALAFRPDAQIAVRPYQEDAFYAFDCAKHLALDQGFTVDGVHPTNGVQPLIVILYSICFYSAGSDKWLGVRFTFILLAIIESLCVFLVYQIINKLKKKDVKYAIDPALTGAVVWAMVLSNLIFNGVGLETGLYAMMILLSIYKSSGILSLEKESKKVHPRHWYLLGAILGMTVLARIDGIFLVAGVVGVDFLLRKEHSFINRITPALIVGSVAILISSPWWIYNYRVFGSLMPISGQSESIGNFIPMNIEYSITQLANIFPVLFYFPIHYPASGWVIGLSIFVLLTIMFVGIYCRIGDHLKKNYEIKSLYALVVASIFLIMYYTFFFAAPHFIGRYFHPIRISAMLFGVLLLPSIYKYWKSINWKSPLKFFITTYLAVAIVFNIAHYIYNFTFPETSYLFWTGMWAQQHPEYTIGMTSSGTAGFMSENVVNLDGKVNVEALRARNNNAIGKYIMTSGIDVLTSLDHDIVKEVEQLGAKVTLLDSVRGTEYYYIKYHQ